MLDRHVVPILKAPLRRIAVQLHKFDVTADAVTMVGFVVGMLAVAALAWGFFTIALLLLLLSRIADGVDGEMARLTEATDAGAFLDIVLDFVFYAMFPLGFALYNPDENALAAALLVASFVGTGASFLAFDSFAQRRTFKHPNFSYKGFYYLNGLAEGTETIITFVLMCLFPEYFVVIASVFALVCVVTAINRIVFSYTTLRNTGL